MEDLMTGVCKELVVSLSLLVLYKVVESGRLSSWSEKLMSRNMKMRELVSIYTALTYCHLRMIVSMKSGSPTW
jgi:hypothetical protein